MANKGYVSSILNRLPSDLKLPLTQVFDYILDNLRLGRLSHEERAENFQGYGFTVTTSTTAGEEFSFAHGFGETPYLLVPVLPLESSGAEIVPLRVSRPADTKRVYLSSTVAGATIQVYVEV
jgi:hypothetical protein